MKIKPLDVKSLRNNEHFQFCTEFKALVEKYNAETLKIKPLFDTYEKAYNDEDEAMLVVRKSSVSEDILVADSARDSDFRGFSEAVKAAQKHFNQQIVVAANKVKILLHTTGNISSMAKDQKTSKLYNLVQELQSPTYSQEIALMKLDEWVNRMQASNLHFEVLTRQRVEEVSQRSLLKVKATRQNVDDVYKAILSRIEAYLILGEDEPYQGFIPELNAMMDNYRQLLAQRQGRIEATKNKGKIADKEASVE